MEGTKKYCECGGRAGYRVKDGELVCNSCGGLSPSARVHGNAFVKIGEKRIVCPKCGTVIQEAMPETKIGQKPEDKMLEPPEAKSTKPKRR